MTAGAKREFRRFQGFYLKGQLQDQYIKRLKNRFESGLNGENGVVQSWFDYCEEQHGKIEQTLGEAFDVLAKSNG